MSLVPCGSAPTCAVRAETNVALAGISQRELWKDHLWNQERSLLSRESRRGDLFTLMAWINPDHSFIFPAYLLTIQPSWTSVLPPVKKGIVLEKLPGSVSGRTQ